MACNDYTSGEISAMTRDSFNALQERCDLATRLLCELTSKVPKKYIEDNEELKRWVKEHAAADKLRKQEEARERARECKQLQQQIDELKKRMEKL
jgi:predicted P-loop ATPase